MTDCKLAEESIEKSENVATSEISEAKSSRKKGNQRRKLAQRSNLTEKMDLIGSKQNRFSPRSTQINATMLSIPLMKLALGIVLNLGLASAHGTLVDPVSRNSLWRIDGSAPVNYNDIELFCGGIGVVTQMGGKCGLCGDAYNLRTPRPHETGGLMVMNRTVKNYFPRSSLDVVINLDTNHGGYFEFELCRRQSFDELETEDCFEPLNFIDGSRRMRLRADHSDRGLKSVALLMPEDLIECQACILRWNYRAGNNWGVCQDGSQGMGCGPQELYRNCADISIGYFHYHYDNETQLVEKSLQSLLLAKSFVTKTNSTSSDQEETLEPEKRPGLNQI